MRPIEKIVRLSHGRIYELIDTFFNKLTPNTRNAYARDIELFFKYLRNKDLQSLTRDDLNVTYAEMQEFQNQMDKQYSSSTVNRVVAAVRSLYKFLSKSIGNFTNEEGIDLVKSVSVDHLKNRPKSYGILQYDEYLAILEAIGSQYKAKEKRLFIETAFYTSYRINALRNLTWENFVFDADSGDYYVETIDKGDKETHNGIPGELYKRLRDGLYNDADPLGEKAKVFGLQQSTINAAIKQACEDVGIDHERRNITFHSLKKLGVTMTYQLTGDIKIASEQGSHANIATTSKYYVPKRRPLGDMPLIRAGKPLDLSPLEKMSKEELIALIEQADYITKLRLLKAVQK